VKRKKKKVGYTTLLFSYSIYITSDTGPSQDKSTLVSRYVKEGL